MILTPEQRAIGRRNFLKAVAGTPALATLGAVSAMQGPVRGGPVRLGVIGVGGQGRALLGRVNPAFGEVKAIADINPASLAKADEVLATRKQSPATHYVEWKEMLEKENIEAVVVAVPLWAHADVVVPCLEAGKHVLCEKMMAWDVAGCLRMMAAAEKANRVLEIGYQRNYNPVYQAAYDGIIKRELLGDVYHSRFAWHRNGNWRRAGGPPSPDYDPSRWGYPTFEHLWNWRLYWQVLERVVRGALQPSPECGQLVPRNGAGRGARIRGRAPVQGRPRSPRSHLFDLRVSQRLDGHLLVHRVECVRPAVRDVFRHQSDARHVQRDRGAAVRRRRRRASDRR